MNGMVEENDALKATNKVLTLHNSVLEKQLSEMEQY